jgi:predicted nucleic acid-binding protein
VAVYFFDSSAIVKRYVQEPGTGWVQALAHPRAGNLNYLAHITGVEVCAAISRRRRTGTIGPPDAVASLARFRRDLAQEYLVIEITGSVLADAMRLADVRELRAYDAVQLAAALELNALWLATGMGGITLISNEDLPIRRRWVRLDRSTGQPGLKSHRGTLPTKAFVSRGARAPADSCYGSLFPVSRSFERFPCSLRSPASVEQ